MTETNLKNYQERAYRTMPALGTNAIDGAHMALGITTEVDEMIEGAETNNIVNIREEHGDVNWYIANNCNIYGLSFERIYNSAITSLSEPFVLHNLVDLHKRELAYGKKMDTHLLEVQLVSLVKYLIKIAASFGFSYEESLSINIAKLYKRYPEKFTQEAALNRDLEAEHETLK